MLGERLTQQVPGTGVLGQVGDGDGSPPTLGQRMQRCLVAARPHDRGAVRGQQDRRGAPDTATGTGDQRDRTA